MSKSDEGPQSLSHKVLEVVYSAYPKTQQVLAELRAAAGPSLSPRCTLLIFKSSWITEISYRKPSSNFASASHAGILFKHL